MAEVTRREWKVPGQKTKAAAWGYIAREGKGGKQVRHFRSGWTREQAATALAQYLLKVEAPKAPPAGLTLQEAADRYLLAKARKKTVPSDRRHLVEFVSAFGATTPLAEITSSKIAGWKATKLAATCPMTGEPYAVATINRPLATLRGLLRMAKDEWEVLTTVPRIKQDREPEGRLRWLTEEEIVRLLAACDQSQSRELRHAVVVALNTGLRLGELYGLVWDRVDLSRSVIQLELTKSGRRREVPVNADTYGALVALTPRPAGRVFRVRDPRQSFRAAVRRAKLEDFHFHDLRHSFASHYMMRGGGLYDLQKILGHSDVKMTARYAHLSPQHLRAGMERMEGLTGLPVDRTQGRTQEAFSSANST
jgi:integrase